MDYNILVKRVESGVELIPAEIKECTRLQMLFMRARNSCKCNIIKKKEYGGAECSICGRDIGWYCPDSPDKICHYFSEKNELDERIITLTNGEEYRISNTCLISEENESPDSCLFCCLPNERK